MAKEALSVAGNYEIAVSLPEIAALLIAVGVSILLFFLAKATKKGFCILQRLVTGIVICLCMVFYVYTGFVQNVSEESDITYRTFKVEDQYEARGFVPAFLEYLSYVNPADKPQKYNETTMDTISAKYADGSAAGETQQTETPNIIAIMSESFWDASRLNTIKLDEPLLPVYENLKKEGMYGELFSHVLNGGTVVSEFEFLTGFSGEFFPSDYMVYGNYLKKDFYSAVGILKNQGYATMAFHPYTSSNYNRENAYLKMGFDQRFFEDSFEDTKIIRNYISDESMYKKMISEYENRTDKTQPVFMFGVTMQNHGGYWKDSIYEEKKVGFMNQTGHWVNWWIISEQQIRIRSSFILGITSVMQVRRMTVPWKNLPGTKMSLSMIMRHTKFHFLCGQIITITVRMQGSWKWENCFRQSLKNII